MTLNQDIFLRLFAGYGTMGPSKKQGYNKNRDGQDHDKLSKPDSSEVELSFSLYREPMRCRGRFSPSARSLAVHLQRLGWLLVLATIFSFSLQRWARHLQASFDGHTHTPQAQDPQSGRNHRAHKQTRAGKRTASKLPSNVFTAIARRIQHFNHMQQRLI